LSEKIVFITGASSGIGKAIAEFLQDRNYKVYGTSRNPEKYSNSKVKLLSLDVTDINSIKKAIDKVVEKEDRIDVIINNAGVGITGALEEIPAQEIRRNFETNFFGAIEIIKSVLPQMRKQNSGKIINITSIAGYFGLPYRSVYSASKSALEILTEAVRMEVKQFGIEIVNVAPGDFATNIAKGRYHAPITQNSHYEKSYQKILKQIDSHVDSGSDPIEIAKIIHKIIISKKPKIHYKVGKPLQKFSIVLKRILPDIWYEKLIMNHYNM